MSYLEESADLIRKHVATYEKSYAADGSTVREARQWAAEQFAILAAIEKGLLPTALLDRVEREV